MSCLCMKLRGPIIRRHDIQMGVQALALELTNRYKDLEEPLIVVGVMDGAAFITCDLVRELEVRVQLEWIKMSSYPGKAMTGEKTVQCVFDTTVGMDLIGRHILIVDDILDTGGTLHAIQDMFLRRRPASLRFAVVGSKNKMRKPLCSDVHALFQFPDEFMVGYGMNYGDLYRDLPGIGYMEKSCG